MHVRAAVLAAGLLFGCRQLSTEGETELTITQLKYRLDDHYTVFFCDPDYWPIVRGDEQERAIDRFPAISADAERFSAILKHLGLTGQTDFSAAQKLDIYREDKRLNSILLESTGSSYAYQIRAQETNSYFSITGEIDRFGRLSREDKRPGSNACPICLSGATRIATARGEVAVQDLREGEMVWTLDAAGRRVLTPARRTARAPLDGIHLFIRIRLDDGRELLASPPHPLMDGRYLADLSPGDEIDGHRIVALIRTYSKLEATYDLLPDGPTGVYWANGIPLLTTIR